MIDKDISEIQSKLLILLKAIDSICKQKDIVYMLQTGTLLGAIREKGFIPWDDDADIMMHRKDFEAFEKVCKKSMDNHNLVIDYSLRIPKVSFSEDPEIFSEIILIDSLPDNKLKRKYKIFMLKLLQGMMKHSFNYESYSMKERIMVFTTSSLGKLFSEEAKLEMYSKMSSLWNDSFGTKYFFSNHMYRFMSCEIEKSLLDEAVKVPFVDTELAVPKGWDSILKLHYGNDYMIPRRDDYYV